MTDARKPLRPMTRKAEGFALLDLIFVVGIIGVLALIALPRMLAAKQAAGASSAIGSMRAINSAELTFALTCGNGFYAPNLTALGTAPAGSNESFISGGLGAANIVSKSGYNIQVNGTPFAGAPPTCNGLAAGVGAQAFKAAADPTEPANPRFFATNANGQIYEFASSLFSVMPESGEPPSGNLLR